MNHLTKSILIITSCFLLSCKEDRSKVELLEKEVFAVHDEVMPQMSKIMDLKDNLSSYIKTADSLLKINPQDKTVLSKQAEALVLSTTLQKADDGMMDWMRLYKSDTLSALPVSGAMAYLQAEKIKIDLVKKQTTESIAKAEQFLKK
jgi:hypothetical protein